MPRATWPLRQGSPVVRVVLTMVADQHPLPLVVLADTGAGSNTADFEFLLEESDCLLCGGQISRTVRLGGAYTGTYPVYQLPVSLPELGFNAPVLVVGVPANPQGFEGVAGFRFLNQFTYGNFGNPAEFGLET